MLFSDTKGIQDISNEFIWRMHLKMKKNIYIKFLLHFKVYFSMGESLVFDTRFITSSIILYNERSGLYIMHIVMS